MVPCCLFSMWPVGLCSSALYTFMQWCYSFSVQSRKKGGNRPVVKLMLPLPLASETKGGGGSSQNTRKRRWQRLHSWAATLFLLLWRFLLNLHRKRNVRGSSPILKPPKHKMELKQSCCFSHCHHLGWASCRSPSGVATSCFYVLLLLCVRGKKRTSANTVNMTDAIELIDP